MPFHFALLLLLFATVLPYWNVYSFEFLNWDDLSYVTDRPEIRSGLTGDGVRWAFVTFQNANVHPLTWLSYMTEVEFFGLRSSAMHLTNLAIHCGNTLLVACLIRRWTGSFVLPFGVALFFGIHPQHVEVVAWVSERKELLAIFFGLLAMLSWDSYVVSTRRAKWWLAHLFFLLSLMSKQMLVTLPLLFVVLEVCPLRDSDTRILWDRIPGALLRVSGFLVLTLGFTICIFAAQESGGAVLDMQELPFAYRLANGVQSLVFYVVQTFVPMSLIPFYRHPFLQISIPGTMICTALLMASGSFIWIRRRQPGVLAGALWFLGTLIPVIGLVQLGSAARADRYMYFPHLGLFMMLGRFVLSCTPETARRLGYAIACFAIVLIPVTYRQANYWRDSITLWRHCLQIDPVNFRARELLSLALLSEERVDEALVEAELAIQLPENQFAGGTNTILGSALLIRGETDRAIFHLRKGIELKPHDYRALVNLGYALKDSNIVEAHGLFKEALRVHPENVEAMANLANCEAQMGDLDSAIRTLRNACRLAPDDARLRENLRLLERARNGSSPP